MTRIYYLLRKVKISKTTIYFKVVAWIYDLLENDKDVAVCAAAVNVSAKCYHILSAVLLI